MFVFSMIDNLTQSIEELMSFLKHNSFLQSSFTIANHLNKLIEIEKENCSFQVFSLIIGSITAIATIGAVIYSAKAVKASRITIQEMATDRRMSNQTLYPLITFRRIVKKPDEMMKYTPSRHVDFDVATSEIDGNNSRIIRVNNGNITPDTFYMNPIYLELKNASKAIITSIRLVSLSILKPSEILNGIQTYSQNLFKDKSEELFDNILLPDEVVSLELHIFQETETTTFDSIIHLSCFSMQLEITVITGLKFYQNIMYTWKDFEYQYATSKEQLQALPLNPAYGRKSISE